MFPLSCVITACMLCYCNTVRWAWWDWELCGWLTTLLQCFDTAGWVIRPVTISFMKWPILFVSVVMLNLTQPTSEISGSAATLYAICYTKWWAVWCVFVCGGMLGLAEIDEMDSKLRQTALYNRYNYTHTHPASSWGSLLFTNGQSDA